MPQKKIHTPWKIRAALMTIAALQGLAAAVRAASSRRPTTVTSSCFLRRNIQRSETIDTAK